MKKITSTLCILLSAGMFMFSNAQNCGTNGSGACSATGGPLAGGFGDVNNIPCAEQGVSYNHAVQFTMFTDFNFQGQQSVDSIEFISINNLPCGLCWSVDQTDKRYTAGEDGCIKFSGTTNEAVGQYKLAISLKAWINNQDSGLLIPASLVDQTGTRLFIRVKAAAGQCPSVDTSVAYQGNLQASLSCPVGINEVNDAVSSLTIMPNPMTNDAVVSFIAAQPTDYTLLVTDVTGREVSVKQVEVKTGENRIAIQRNGLPAGVYFLVLSDGKNALSRRFSITE